MPSTLMILPKKVLALSAMLILVLAGAAMFFTRSSSALETRYTLYSDNLDEGWSNWSWSSTINPHHGDTISGAHSLSFLSEPWGGLYIHANQPLPADDVTHLQFLIKPHSSEQKYRIFVADQNNSFIDNSFDLQSTPAEQLQNGWRKYTIPLAELNASGKIISGIIMQEGSGLGGVNTLIDDIKLLSNRDEQKDIKTTASSDVFVDFLSKGWFNWSWGGNMQMSNEIIFSHQPWAGLYLRADQPFNTKEHTHLAFDMRSNVNNLPYKIALYDGSNQKMTEFIEVKNFGGEVTTDWKSYSIPLSALTNGNSSVYGIVIHDGSGQNAIVYLDSVKFISNGNTAQRPIESVKEESKIISTSSTSGYSTANNKIYKDGQQIQLRGVNWFGFETEIHAPHGLWLRNWKDMVSQIKQAGFNSVRVPFCPATINSSSVSGIDYSINPDLRGLNSLEILDKVVTEMNNQQIYVLLDHHRPDCQAISQLWYTDSYTEAQWIKDLQFVANRYLNREYFMGIDLKNEPHGSATWGTGNPRTDWNKAAEKAGKAVLSVNPKLLIFVEGVQENSKCSSSVGHWMGGNIEPIACDPIDTKSIPANKLVLSPHVYGPDVYPQNYFNDANFPHNMNNIWDTHFGNAADEGHTIVPGEWGGKYGEGDPRDIAWQRAMANYFQTNGICNSYYWSWNPNSGDTGGILRDDWKTMRTDKLDLIMSYFNSCR